MLSLLALIFVLIRLVGSQLIANVPAPHGCYNFGLCKTCPNPNNATTCTCASGNCVCQNGTSGGLCETIIDECSTNPCPVTGEWNCTNTLQGAVCTCGEGFTGNNCDIPMSSPCAAGPCLNGGSCISPDNVTYTCNCANGYIPPVCQYKDPCANKPCLNNGTCSRIYDGEAYICKCPSGFFDLNCGTFSYYWKASAATYVGCLPYNTALEDSSKYLKITDGQMTYTKCRKLLETTKVIPPYTMYTLMGTNCYLSRKNYLNSTSYKYDANCNTTCPGNNQETCASVGALLGINSRVLFNTDYPTAQNQNCSAISTSVCAVDSGNGYCVSVNASTNAQGYVCLCDSPYTQNGTATACIPPSPCLPNPCQNLGTCTANDDKSDYNCTCRTGYVGKNCSARQSCDPNPCLYGSTCIDNLNGKFTCNCLPWYSGNLCQNINVCQYANPCKNGTCSNRGTGIQVWPKCTCYPGYTGTYCQSILNYCTTYKPCQNNGTCTAGFMSYNCSCIPGTTDTNCSTIINNCVPYTDTSVTPPKTYPTRCNTKDNHAQCINAINSFSCNCSSQWTQDYCDLNVIIEQVMITIYGKMDSTMLPLLNNLLQTPAMISNMVPFIIGTLTPDQRVNLSWSAGEMFDWASYEEKELDLGRDFFQWNDVVLGNCFTFNHLNATQLVRLKVNQQEYEPWTDTAAILVFIHFRDDYVMSESVRYNAEPNNEIIFFPYVNTYTRLGGAYGTCVNSISEVKSFYFPGDYTTDGCLRSCYQDMVVVACDCMDPRYPMPDNVASCDVANMTCIDDASAAAGDPSTWPDCVCPLPCSNNDYGITWSKSAFRLWPTACINPLTNAKNVSCQAQQQDSVIVSVMLPELTYSLFAETPAMDLNGLIGNLGALLGVLMGICAITFIEIGVMIFTVCASICCKPDPAKLKP